MTTEKDKIEIIEKINNLEINIKNNMLGFSAEDIRYLKEQLKIKQGLQNSLGEKE
jgi:hypothetical protein